MLTTKSLSNRRVPRNGRNIIITSLVERLAGSKSSRMIGALAISSAFMAVPAFGQVAYTTGGSNYTQNFDNLFATPTPGVPANNTTQAATVLPAGWVFTESGANANTTLRVDNGSSGTGDTYLFGATGSNERAFGAYASGSLTSIYGAQIQNNTGATLTQFTLTFDGEQWKDGGSAAAVINTDTFSYGLGNTSLTSGSFTNVAALNFSATVNNTSSDATLDGNASANRTAGITATITGLNWTNGQSLWIRWSDPNDAGNDDALGVDNVVFTALNGAAPANITWNTASGAWDTTTGNWAGGTPTANLYKESDNVTFDNSATGGTVTIQSGGVSPGSTTVNNDATHPYTFADADSTNGIKTGTLAKSGVGTLTLTGPNSYIGGTSITGGIVQIDGSDRLGTGPVTLNGGELQSIASGAISLPNDLQVGASGGAFDTGAQNATVATASSVGGLLTKAGAGNLTVTGTFLPIAGGGVAVSAGNLILGQATGTVKLDASGTLTGNLVLNGPIRLDVDDAAIVSGTGQVQVVPSGALISNTSGNAGGTISAPIALNSTGVSFTAGSWTGSTYSPGNFTTTIGATKGANTSTTGNLTIGTGGGITGNSDVDFSNNSSTGGGGGVLRLNAASTYTGNTTINAGTPDVAGSSSIVLGVNNALPTTTGVIVGTKTGVGAPILDLNGFSQQVGYLADGANVTGSKFLTITNNGAADSTLTLSGSTTPGNGFGGVIKDGSTNKIALVKDGVNTQTLSGANTYTGTTTISGGTLAVTGSLSASSAVSVGSSGTLGGNGSVGSVALGGTIAPSSATNQLGSLTTTGETWSNGGAYGWQINDGTGTAGANWDFLNIGGTLDLTNLTANQFTIKVGSLNSVGTGAAAAAHMTTGESWVIATASNITGFNLGDFNIDTTGFSNAGSFALSEDGTTGLRLTFTGPAARSITWTNGAATGAWNSTDANFAETPPTPASSFNNGDNVTFDDTNATPGTVAIAGGGVSPGSTVVSNATGTYTFTGGAIGGGGSLTKSGAGTLILNNSNTYSGGTIVTGGLLQLGNGNILDDGSAVNVNGSTAVLDLAHHDETVGAVTLTDGTIQSTGGTSTLTASSFAVKNGSISLNLARTGSGVGLTKSTGGTVALSGTNTYTGGTEIDGGILAVSSGNAGLGDSAGAIIFGGGTLRTDTAGITAARAITVNTGGGTFDSNGQNSSDSGNLTLNAPFIKAGVGDLTLSGKVTTNAGGSIAVSGGSLTLAQTAGGANDPVALTTDSSGTAWAGNLVIANAIRANFNVGSFSGGGQIQVQTTNTSIADSGSALSSVIGNNIVLNSNHAAQPFVTNIGPTSGNTITISGVISGDSDVNLAVGNNGGAGTLVLSGQSTYTGATTINTAASGTVQLGIDNALPTTTALIFGSNSGAGPGTLDLDGHSLQIASLSFGGQGTASNAKITNTTNTLSILTVSGSTTPANAFAGVISGGTGHHIELIKDGASTLTLTGANTYTGGTFVNGGTLALSGTGSIKGNVTVAPGAIFDVSGLTGGYTLATGQTLGGKGTITGNIAITAGATLSPGASPGILGETGTQSWADSGNYNWQILDATGAAGVGFDQMDITGGLDLTGLTGTGATGFDINLWSLSSITPTDTNGQALDWDNTLGQSWVILTASTGISGFDASHFNILTAANDGTGGFVGAGGGTFSLSLINGPSEGSQELLLSFTPGTTTPEPTSFVLLAAGGLMIGTRRGDRKRV